MGGRGSAGAGFGAAGGFGVAAGIGVAVGAVVGLALALTAGAASAAAATVTGVAATGAVPAGAAAAGSVGAPVKVDVSSDVQNAKAGDVVTYTVHVHNLSKSSFPHLVVSHELPAGFKVVSSTPRAAKTSAGAQWTVDLAPGQSLALSDTVRAGTVAEAEHLSPKGRSTGTGTNVSGGASAGAGTAASSAAGSSGGAGGTGGAGGSRTFTTTACARDGVSGATIACGEARQALADGGAAAAGGNGWQPGLVGLGLVAAGLGAVRGRVRKYQAWRGKGGA